ncbi:histidine utilization repressor [Xanthomonas graminis]|jgi:GntR family histidine utilization transcriptional repressor|uniref:Histidine utilization repressor n=1 Tax=Xanthomonas graminis pv. graminis TaxID=134874 RepID=A0A1M4J893_9XANT|nr:histidine utilization repressor [Xanthomonas translucens]EKU24561.1 Histidine utilization repressor [Xanthomonas translucens pv. graminis ART-Xtg29]OAX58666.1 histidine utilization repressor [Xanthomonas translucens pv. graminis]UKE55797.1 histidine utilization repressor [Xanthomonas translucens pv. graminis]WIH07256.1 histidine utilization repressor [Xanthomonas translucens pv. graminis]WIH13850.1 histidine utilization repressor [Xanthomonas translucens pv. graminis]
MSQARPAATLNQRIRRDIEGHIRSGEWPPGHRIPSEHALMAQYACSRMTVNKVLAMLADAGMIERRRRAGSFVARPHPHMEQVALEIPDIPVEVAARGHAYRFELIERRQRAPHAALAQEAEVAAAGTLLSLHCLHFADGRPFALEERVINPVAVPEALQMDFAVVVPGSWLLQHVPWTRAEHRISAVGANPAQAARLQVAAGTACLLIDRQTWRGEQAVTFVRQVFLGDTYDLVARFSPGAR